MDLKTWCDKEGVGARNRLFRLSGVTLPVIADILETGRARTTKIARRLSDATGGEVTVAELCDPQPHEEETDPGRMVGAERR